MKNEQNIAVIAAKWRKQHGNEYRAYKINKVGRPADAIKQEIVRQSKLSLKRQQITVCMRQRIKMRITHKLKAVASALPDDGISMGSFYNVYVDTTAGIYAGSVDRTKEYARSCKYRAKHYRHTFTLEPSDVCRLIFAGEYAFIKMRTIAEGVYHGDWITAEGSKQRYRIIRKPVYFTNAGHVYNTVENLAKAVAQRLAA